MTKAQYLSQCGEYGLPCKDCKGPNQGYMVQWDLWGKYAPGICSTYSGNIMTGELTRNPGTGNFICISCFEKRLGRDLRVKDFTDAPINFADWGPFDCRVYCSLPKVEAA